MLNWIRNHLWFKDMGWEDIKNTEDYLESKKLAKTYLPTDSNSYSWIYEYAFRRYDDAINSIKTLDDKADNMIRYLAPSLSLLGFAIAFWIPDNKNNLLTITIGISIIFIIASIIYAIYTRIPQQQAILPKVWGLFDTKKHYPDTEMAKAIISMSIEKTITVLGIVGKIKAERLERSYKYFAIAIMLLMSSLVFYILTTII